MTGFDEVRELLPQRDPFVFVDQVIEVVEGKRIVCLKNFTRGDFFAEGMGRPGDAVAESLLIEAMAQTSILLFRKAFAGAMPVSPDSLFVLANVDAKFSGQAFPGDQVTLEAEAVKVTSRGAIVSARAAGERGAIAEVQFTLGVASRNSLGGHRDR